MNHSFSLTVPPPSWTARVALQFSYAEFTQLQVQGAIDRSQRQRERSEWERKLIEATDEWNIAVESVRRRQDLSRVHHSGINDPKYLQRMKDRGKEDVLYQEAVERVLNVPMDFEQMAFQISPFMRDRLAVVLRKEYQAFQLEKTLDTIHAEQMTLVQSLCQGIQTAETDTAIAIRGAGLRIQQARLRLEEGRLGHIQQYQSMMQCRRRMLLETLQRKRKLLAHEEQESTNDFDLIAIHASPRTFSASASCHGWLEATTLDDNHFPSVSTSSAAPAASENANALSTSDWVVCGYYR